MTPQSLANKRIGFLGTGNMSQALISAFVNSKVVSAEKILAANRTPGKLQKIKELYGVASVNTNEELIESSDIVLIGVKPQDFFSAVESLRSTFRADQIVISMSAGIEIKQLQKILPNVTQIVRIMPNTPAKIQKGVIGYALAPGASGLGPLVEALLRPAGIVVQAEEGENFRSLMVASSSGIGFIYELMMYWQEWLEEHDFDSQSARDITVQTFLGAALLAEQEPDTAVSELQNRVVSKKGVTAAGLLSMQELEIERLLRYSFEKADLRDQELGKTSV